MDRYLLEKFSADAAFLHKRSRRDIYYAMSDLIKALTLPNHLPAPLPSCSSRASTSIPDEQTIAIASVSQKRTDRALPSSKVSASVRPREKNAKKRNNSSIAYQSQLCPTTSRPQQIVSSVSSCSHPSKAFASAHTPRPMEHSTSSTLSAVPQHPQTPVTLLDRQLTEAEIENRLMRVGRAALDKLDADLLAVKGDFGAIMDVLLKNYQLLEAIKGEDDPTHD